MWYCTDVLPSPLSLSVKVSRRELLDKFKQKKKRMQASTASLGGIERWFEQSGIRLGMLKS